MWDLLQDPIIIALLSGISLCGFLALRSRLRAEVWLLVLTVLLFALPRAGVVVRPLSLPLPLTHILAVIFIVEWLLVRKAQPHLHRPYGHYFIIFALVVALSLVVGLVTGGKYMIAGIDLFFYLFMLGIFFYASESFSEKRHFLFFCRLLLVISVFVGIYGIAQKYLGSSILINYVTYNSSGGLARSYIENDIADRRVLSSYGDPNVLSSQLVVFLAIALSLMITQGISRRLRLACLGIFVVNLICLIYTGSRAGLIALAVIGILILSRRTRWALLVFPGLLLLGYFYLPTLLSQSLAGKFQGLVTMDDMRARFPEVAWQLLQIIPFGSGLGRTVIMTPHGLGWSFQVTASGGVWAGFNSFWLNLFSQLGIAGLIAFILLIGMLFRWVWRTAKLVPDPRVRAIIIGTLMGFIGQWLIWIVNNTYMLPGGGLNFWFTMGMLVAGCRAFALQQVSYPVMYPAPNAWLDGKLVTT